MSEQLIRVVGAAIVAEGRCLVAQRALDGAEPLRWEFPGGKIEAGESPQQALRREIREELGVDVEVGRWIGRGTSTSPKGRIQLDVYQATLLGGVPLAHEHADLAWLGPGELAALDWADADIPIVAAVRRLTAGA